VRQELHALFAKMESKPHDGGSDSDPSLLITYDRLCTVYRSSSRHNNALAVAERALTLAESLGGPGDPLTLAWLNNTSELLLLLDRIEESEQHLEQAYHGYEACSGPSDATTLAVLENLAVVTLQRRQFAPAERLLRVLLERLTAIYDGGWNDRIMELHVQLGVAVLEQVRRPQWVQIQEALVLLMPLPA
jgi:hypothetical protein